MAGAVTVVSILPLVFFVFVLFIYVLYTEVISCMVLLAPICWHMWEGA